MSSDAAEQGAEAFRIIKASEGLFDDDVVYVAAQGSRIGIDGGRLVVKYGESGEVLSSFPLEKINTVNIFGNVSVSTPFLSKCNRHGMVVNYFTRYGKYVGSFSPDHNTIAEIRRHQAALNAERALAISKVIVGAKIRNSRTLLARKKIKPPKRLKELEFEVLGAAGMNQLRGVEGEAASIYFAHLNECLIEGWIFEKRTRRPPKDHLNSLLSLTYAMMKNEVMSGLRQYNLDPYIGVMHTDRHGRPALALDLLEEFRPIFCDAFALRLVNQRILDHDDFGSDNRLKDHALKKYLSLYDDYMKETFNHPKFKYAVTKRRSVIMQAILLRKAITGEMKQYHPLVFTR
ncbi:type I-D CRISPR-associated endonuclease Cas1d [Methanocalculus sp.]|uniref:type I-D CRISPR-associated endonuclease Cas1d n=1 Tax=Methanocalculus sp. TaxID=2004547 RepID=UPI002637F338|nr:type I-D CRISPR-associated endonuclease Cas1d [Methanocalculus sp.]MDG6249258.1 type I-D CRISPR-associated endonuclease Cas1d [Methanocalculus sp.]